MIDPVGYAGADDAEIVGDATVVGQPVGNPEATLPVLVPLAFGFEEGRIHFPHRGDGTVEAFGERLAGQFVEEWFWIKEIDVAGTSLHEEKDDVLGFAPAVRNLGESGVRRSPGEETFVGKRR